MSAVSAPADRRFRRAHVKPSRKHRYGPRVVKPLLRYGLGAIVVLFAVYRGSSVVAHARVLQIDRIVVGGNERMSKSEVLALLNGLRGESLVWADLDRWRSRLLASPWVRDAALRRSLPSTVEVVVWERQATMLARVDGEMYLVDERGAIIDQFGPQYADLDLPLVDGLLAAPGGRDTVVRISTPGCADGTSHGWARSPPCSAPCGPATGSARGTAGTHVNKMKSAPARKP